MSARPRAALASIAALALGLALARPAAAECPPPVREALELAKEADRTRATDAEAALAKYRRAAELAPGRHGLLWRLAFAQIRAEDYSAAAATLERAIALAPRHAGYAAARGAALARVAQRGQADALPAARASLEAALALDPSHAEAHHELADVLLRLGDERGALVHETRAIELSPEKGAWYTSLADLYLRLRHVDEADAVLREGLARVKDDAPRFPMLLLRGDALARKGDGIASLTAYEEAKRACGACGGPGQPLVYFRLGASYAAQSPPRKSEAMANLQAFQRLICKGAAAARYTDECTEAYGLAVRMGGALH